MTAASRRILFNVGQAGSNRAFLSGATLLFAFAAGSSLCGQAVATRDAYLPAELAPSVLEDLLGGFPIEDRPPLENVVRTEWIRLRVSGGLAVIVRGIGPGVSGANNGPILVYAREGRRWRKILDGNGIDIWRLASLSHGLYDLELRRHDSAFESEYYVFRFDGEEYKRVSCYGVNYQPFGRRLRIPERTWCTWFPLN